MADQDWNSVTRIGSKARGPGSGGVDREKVIKGKTAINAAQRSGAIVGTEKKYASSNAKSSSEGQFITKVANDDNIVAPKTVGTVVGKAISTRRTAMVPKMTQTDLANKTSTKVNVIQEFESGKAAPDNTLLLKIQKVLGVKLTGKESEIGTPITFGPKKK